ncbi:MAG: winged helix-turn-helix transcriptional regulator [Candidatus Freyrarchaeum guaymaensis]|nr:winged helix-turn-helix transcriptional regulator [Candidatus Sigynarchaeota archaeon]
MEELISFLSDQRVWLLIERLLVEPELEFLPEFSRSSNLGFRYPLAEKILEMDVLEAFETLNRLSSLDILHRNVVDVMLICPECKSYDIHLRLVCPKCGSGNITTKKVVEHFECGLIDLKEKFGKSTMLFCPECKKKLRSEGEDYKITVTNTCESCGALFSQSMKRMRCFNCGSEFKIDEAERKEIYSFRFNKGIRPSIVNLLAYRPMLTEIKPSRKRKVELDPLNVHLLNILQKDGRTSFREISRKMKVSDATIRDRVNKLLKSGIIEEITAIVDPKKVGKEEIAFILLEVEPSELTKNLSTLKDMPEVKFVCETAGKENVVIMVFLENRAALKEFIDQKVNTLPATRITQILTVTNFEKRDLKIIL